MARQFLTIAIVLFAITGLAASATTAPSVAPASNDVIGNTDPGSSSSGGGDDVAAGPVGGPVPDGVFPPTPDTTGAPAPSASGSSIAKISVVAGVSAAAIVAVFY